VRLDPQTEAKLANATSQIVIERIAQQAAENERPLTAEEQQRLAASRGPEVDPFFEARIVIFLHRIVAREQGKAGHLDVEFKLKDVLRYAGADRSYAMDLVRQVVSQPMPPVSTRRWLTDKAALLLWVPLGLLGVFAVFFILNVMGVLR
jgi:hypothetical protein